MRCWMKYGYKIIFCLLIVAYHQVSFSSSYQRMGNEIVFTLNPQRSSDPQRIKIQVCTPDIIHILATIDTVFSNRQSLMVEHTQWDSVAYSVKEIQNTVFIETANLRVAIQTKTGSISFRDRNGKIILQENPKNGKIITPAEVLGEKTFHVQQLFETQSDEAYYGLGGHQNAVMNYKHHDVDLWQHNMVESIPFLVSNKNCGILWDNNSHTKFGDIREYEPLSTLKLFSKDHIEGGLTADYFRDTNFSSLFTSRIEPRLDHEFIDAADTFPAGFQQNVAAVRWSGQIQSSVSGIYKFRLYRLWVCKTVARWKISRRLLAAELESMDSITAVRNERRTKISNQNRMDSHRRLHRIEMPYS